MYNLDMAKDIYTLAYELKELLDADQRIKDLDTKEEIMKNDEEVKALVNKKEQAISLYMNSSEQGQKVLHQSKLELDNNPIVRDYLDAYIKVRDLFFEMNDILFSGLNAHLKEHR